MARYTVTLERGIDGSYLAWVNELPGCYVRAGSREEIGARLPSEIRAFVAWIGEDPPGELDVRVVEEVDSEISTAEDTEVLVAADREPLTVKHWATVEDWLARSRRELFDLVDALDDEALGERAGADRSGLEELRHVAFVELMYAAWTFDLASRTGLEDFLDWTRGVALERMRSLARAGAGELTSAEWAGAERPEPWTPRKAARRLVWHERLHLGAIRRRAGLS